MTQWRERANVDIEATTTTAEEVGDWMEQVDYLFGPENLMNRYDGNAEMVNTFNDMTLFAPYLEHYDTENLQLNYKLNGDKEEGGIPK